MAKKKADKEFSSLPAPEGETREERDERLLEERRVEKHTLAHLVSPQAGDEHKDGRSV